MRAHPADDRIHRRHLARARSLLSEDVRDAAWRRGCQEPLTSMQERAREAVAMA